jgi:hypothetical protein
MYNQLKDSTKADDSTYESRPSKSEPITNENVVYQ